VGVPVVAIKDIPNLIFAVFNATLLTVPENNPVVPVGIPKPVAVAALFIGQIVQKYAPVAPVVVM
jgi:hypothetical protein